MPHAPCCTPRHHAQEQACNQRTGYAAHAEHAAALRRTPAADRRCAGQVLFAFPPGKPVTPDAAAFCFPHGVQPALLERTPSLSALNELVCSHAYAASDAASFIFTMKARRPRARLRAAAPPSRRPLIISRSHGVQQPGRLPMRPASPWRPR